ncbi:oligogalacturonate lyase family protein [Parabacteroides sp. FAFU027]|uniref:oligogalacturonate lyase family protein n=1 Tax=Parabacteroides sp. FAFU027 TaxID=2922715 RepID=UPI001FAEBD00|nr:oligogalacturonate lyase family protein [Parabacteroides sp. FAFU027]
MKKRFAIFLLTLGVCITTIQPFAQIGKRFPSERKVIKDPVTGNKLIFLTSTPVGDSKIYQTHNQWTSDGKWLIFRSGRVKGEAMAVNEKSGVMVQVTEGGYTGMLNVARKSMKLYFMRRQQNDTLSESLSIVEVDLAKLFADSQAGTMKPVAAYQRICGITPPELEAGGDMALDGSEDWVWFRVGKEEAARHLAPDAKIEPAFGPRHMGAGPAGIAGMNIHTGEVKYVTSVPFQVGHIQTNPWVSGQIIFCWETGGKSPQRTWIVNSDGSGLRPLYPEASYEWVTHEAVISPDEVAIAILGHRKIASSSDTMNVKGTDFKGINPGQDAEWGDCGTREKPTGLGIVNINTREMVIAGQTASGSGFWHVNGSSDKRFVVGDDFARNIYLIDRRTHEMILLSTGHKATAADHPHPTFSPDNTKIEIQSAMLSADGKSMNICVIPVPEKWLKRK